MKRFPTIASFDFEAEDQTENLQAVVASFLELREKDLGWTAFEDAYRGSKYAEHISWSRAYKAASSAEKVALPPPVKPDSKGKTKAPVEIKLEDTIKVSNPDAQAALRQLIADDLKRGENSVILREIQKFMISSPSVARKKK